MIYIKIHITQSMMEFNKDLFLELCEEYNVEFSNEYTDVMLVENGVIKKLTDLTKDDFKRILFT